MTKVKQQKSITTKTHKTSKLSKTYKTAKLQNTTSTYDKHKYNNYYPSINDPQFGKKITSHPIFKNYKLKYNPNKLKELYDDFDKNRMNKSKISKSNVYILKPTQKLLRNFMSPYSPYRGLLIYHEMGVGKTCTAISIAENLKDIVSKSHTKIYVIRPDEIERQIFNINMVKDGTPANQCSGDVYINNDKYNDKYNDLVKKCSNKDTESCAQLKSKIDKDIKQIYEFNGSQMWANSVNKEIELKTKMIENEKEKEEKISSIIKNRFNNAVIIIDEAHEMRDNGSDAKVVPPILMLVLKYASNLRLIFLSATPIYDKPQNIVSMLNYFLLNDNRPIMKENEIFDSNGHLKPSGKTILENNIRGYVSYLRGNNPYDFPIRLSAKYNIPDQMLNLKNYPSKDIFGKAIEKDDKIKHLELVNCPFQGNQLEFINYYIKNTPIKKINENEFDTIMEESNSNKKDSKKKSATNSTNATDDNNAIDDTDDTDDYEIDIPQNVAYTRERQLSNFIYQSLEEANNNINLITGYLGLQQVSIKKQSKHTYEFKDPLYGKRFMLPDLKNWGIKIAKILERAIESSGPIFIYSFFKDSGVIPMAFALEMNGFRRYKQHNTPLLENPYKDTSVYRGDYIIYTGEKSLSQFAKEYLDKNQSMIHEKKVKVFIGTSKASEGINLFGYREVHIMEPWHNINLIEQSIGRIIRTGSHLHLPPQERNVSVYQYATTLKDRESYDLKIYKISETKAINAGIVEKLLKENAFDCDLNKALNSYSIEDYGKEIPLITSNNKHIKVSLADKEYSRSCFYMKDCEFKCSGSITDTDKKLKPKLTLKNKKKIDSIDSIDCIDTIDIDIDIMKFNMDKDIDELKNLIKQLMKSTFNININNLKLYLNKIINGTLDDKPLSRTILSKKLTLKSKVSQLSQVSQLSKSSKKNSIMLTDTDAIKDKDDANNIFNKSFDRAIQDIINEDVMIIDKFNRKGKIVLSGIHLRFIPEHNLIPNISIQLQESKPSTQTISSIDLKSYINELSDKQKVLITQETYNYDEIINKNIIEIAEQIFYGTYLREYKYNVKLLLIDIIEFVFYRLTYLFKSIVIKTILYKIINSEKLSISEMKLENIVKTHIIFFKDISPNIKENSDYKKNIYGFIIQNINHLELFVYNNDTKIFEINSGNIKKVIENKKSLLDKTPKNKLYGFLKYEKKNEVVFKITDIVEKGDKKSVKGITCTSPSTTIIKTNLGKLEPKLIKNINYNSKTALCNDMEMLLKRNDIIKLNNKKWFYTPEEYYIYFEHNA